MERARERRVVWTVALVQLMNVLDFMIVMPLGDDFAKALAIPQASVGYVAGAYTAAALVSGLAGAALSRPPWGGGGASVGLSGRGAAPGGIRTS